MGGWEREGGCAHPDGERKPLFYFDGFAGAGNFAISTEIIKTPFRPVSRLWRYVEEDVKRREIVLVENGAWGKKNHSRLPGRTRRIRLHHRIDAEDVPRARVRPFVHRVAPKQDREARRRHVGRRVGQGSVLWLQLRSRLDAIFAE